MSGTIDFLLDTNFVLALVNGNPGILAHKDILSSPKSRCGVSVISHIELLGYFGITDEEEIAIGKVFQTAQEIPLTQSVRDRAVQIRRSRKLKVPDAIIVATALEFGAELLTLDLRLKSIFEEVKANSIEG